MVAVYDRLFADCGFDGAFLDRVRTQSFVGGVSGVLSCGCPLCREQYLAQGVDLDEVRAAWEQEGDRFLSVTGYTPEGSFTFENPLAARFFAAKGKVVSGAILLPCNEHNNQYHPIPVGPDNDFLIWGIVTWVIKKA